MRSGEGFKQLREERGISQRKLTEGICARSTLATFENEGSHLSVELCSKLLDRLNIRINTYFSMISDDFDSKRAEFSVFKKSIITEDIEELQQKKQDYFTLYTSTRDFYWFNLYLHSERIISQLTDSFSYETFKQAHKRDITSVKKYLNKVENWSHFEFSVFSNSIWYFDLDFIQLIKKRLEKNDKTAVEDKKELYGSFLLNMSSYCLEYGHFELIEPLKEELFELSSYENIYWKTMASFQLSLAGELSDPPFASKKETLSHIRIYEQVDEEDHYENMVKYRKRLIEKHKKGEPS
ncbi:Rgg/GadR/MutR family transcriptional regulator [Alkalibacterium kapii]|uniref:Transcriptional regulator n=1 Tax=Alkalibacterium kapii TaxID=426704 RepID=A0A511B2R3_9LACT|nr:Rgg/GadR/MutR family transcriptional regulator [Alkalibacterium kapii]GEK92097.1 transcriptional regulator [Alkalibacterium kapii]